MGSTKFYVDVKLPEGFVLIDFRNGIYLAACDVGGVLPVTINSQ